MLYKALALLSFIKLIRPTHAFAQKDWSQISDRCVSGDVATIQGLECIFFNILQTIVFFVGLIFFFVLIAGGFQYLFSGGDPKKTAQASSSLTMAILGLAGIIISWLILSLISSLTGLPILQFRIPG